jgi:hypothetical protein
MPGLSRRKRFGLREGCRGPVFERNDKVIPAGLAIFLKQELLEWLALAPAVL